MVANHQANSRERRKELRAFIDGSKKLLVDVCDKARRYLGESQRSLATEAEIKLALQLLEVDLERLPGYADDKKLVQAMARFADAATGGSFESNQKVVCDAASAEVQALAAACVALLSELESLFRREYGSFTK